MLIYKMEDEIIVSQSKEEEPIEKYNFQKEVNFEGLMKYLLSKNLSKKIELSNEIESPSDEEKNLIKIIESLINSYNAKVDALKTFSQ